MTYQWWIYLFFILMGIIIGISLAFAFFKSKYTARIAQLSITVDNLRSDLANLQEENQSLSREKENLQWQMAEKDNTLTQLRAQLKFSEENFAKELARWEEKLAETKQMFEEKEKKFTESFQNLAHKILEETGKKFTEQNREKLNEIIRPFREQLTEFKEKVTHTEKESHARHRVLLEQIKNLEQLNKQITEEARNLANALKGDTKAQGTWGEFILASILEKSGLEKGREYVMQESFGTQSENRMRVRPDVIVYLPENKAVIIDSKVSLTAYERYINTENETEREIHLKAHLESLRAHIRELSKKDYERIAELQGRTPDFVLMFIPVEPAFSIAMREMPGLYDEALRKNIVLVTPTTLLAVLKMIDNIWKTEQQRENIREILRQATGLYEKFVGFTDDLIKLGKQLETAKDTYTQSMKKLSTGKDNLVSKVERMKKLGLNPKKHINPGLIARASDNELPGDEQ